ncbi:MAG: hypothetical protein U0V87_04470 [Acidobacteriota bacterium]
MARRWRKPPRANRWLRYGLWLAVVGYLTFGRSRGLASRGLVSHKGVNVPLRLWHGFITRRRAWGAAPMTCGKD